MNTISSAIACGSFFVLANFHTSVGQKLDEFGADLGKQSSQGKEIRMPYNGVINYFGYVKPGTAPDAQLGGKKYYYLYIWIPAVVPELGVRMISPVPNEMIIEDSDFRSPDYKEKASDKKNYFDTWISLERAEGITSPEEIASKGKSADWITYGVNDDSSELPAQPSGKKYNSLLRITSDPNDPHKSIMVGLYRIAFTSYKTGEVKGGFLAQVGLPVKLRGIQVSKDLESLMKAIQGR